MAIYLTRHGQTPNNLKRLFQGSKIDAPLTELGQQQAKSIADFLKDKNISHYWASPMGRVVQTAEIINQELGLKTLFLPELVEQDFGIFDGKSIDMCRQLHSEFATTSLENTFPLGNSIQEMSNNLKSIISIAQSLQENTLITSHRMTTVAILMGLFPNRKVEHCLIENNQCVVIDGDKVEILSFYG